MLSQPIRPARREERWLVCLDLQRDCVIPGRPRFAEGNTDVAAACARVLGIARRGGWRVVHSQQRIDEPQLWPGERFRAPIEGLRPLITEPVFFRRGLSAFGSPGFADELAAARGQDVYLIGYSLPDTCLATVLAGHDHGVAFTLVDDAMGAGDGPADAAAAQTLLRHYATAQPSWRLEVRQLETTP